MSIDLRDEFRKRYGTPPAAAAPAAAPDDSVRERAFVLTAASGRTVITAPLRQVARANEGFEYLRGRFVEADSPNRNKAMWTVDDLEKVVRGATPALLAIVGAVVALVGLIVITLGAASGNRVFTGAGIAFLALFIAAYFYGVELSMLTKSITLVSTGATVLLARWLLLKFAKGQGEGESDHA